MKPLTVSSSPAERPLRRRTRRDPHPRSISGSSGASAVALVALVGVLPATAEEPSLICFGSEPSWSLDLVSIRGSSGLFVR
jgi:hypothetical protein